MDTTPHTKIPSHARTVIVGGGIIGLSVAYHLAKKGERDVVLLERKELTCGTTWHAAGLVTQLRSTENSSRLAAYTADLFGNLAAETGQETGFRRCGSLTVAATLSRLRELKHAASMASNFGLEVDIISPAEALEIVPQLNLSDMVGAAWIAKDGKTNPIDTARAFAAGARQRGARILEGVTVTGIERIGDRVTGVRTSHGTVICDHIVLCCGMWTRDLAASVGVSVPLHAAEHFYAVTETIPGISHDMPTIRDLDGRVYIKEDAGRLLVGSFETIGKPWGGHGIPANFCFDQLPDDLDHFMPYFENAMHRMPVLGEAGIQLFFNGPESFTPDNRFLLGPTAEIDGLFIAAGFNSCGIESSGGAGKLLADWIVDGAPGADFWDIDVRRAMPFQRNRRYLEKRTSEAMGMLYGVHWPLLEPESARGVRRSPLHSQLTAAGAHFGQAAGFERPLWFAQEGSTAEYSFGRPGWFAAQRAECVAARESVALFDQSSFQHVRIEGSDALSLLQRISAANIDVQVGKTVYTGWLNETGGFESDLTLTRLGERSFMAVTTAAQKTRDLAWLRRHGKDFDSVSVVDVSPGQSTISVMGPKSRALLQTVSPDDFSDEGFPVGSARTIEIGDGLAIAIRMSFVGELGWELHVDSDMAASVHEALTANGGPFGLRLAGYHALDSLRMECGYRDWGLEITDEDTPLEAGLGFAIAWDKPTDFLGRSVLERQRGAPLPKRLCQVRTEAADIFLHGTEPLWRDGKRVGFLKSGAFGHTIGSAIGMGYVHNTDGVTPPWLEAASWEVEVAGERYPATVQLKPWLAKTLLGESRQPNRK
ncbi:MAG: FAD-dependent oxidoreductase [Mesorhizobium sp.]|uniref:GcvT family protein n=1 Tax=Mesorhizobium sp. TaxID=1871066 RepID=UPI000FE37257|nr:FAD-dependent oxidoreductase [Mesorhizobium sp.]RWG80904.1 MAG: FAD-dependent oxidoreductase [Mesorhizobium sp.]RWI44270.1 MAG: FAD-dependent oxidoreductase [Mesorhizobium sp.]RWJ25227.1 MAG: FAD-dependent oxidoreductase [Mesorhizobium sp.]RWJ89641.1 MAG: FAD-dependent oxidoreductase [Mesorhizobium sp.]RWK15021.1 MAG: FAD-dependent oxidoreductase [Mesorhizobium sp.]